MSGPGNVMMALPRPGPALKALLIVIGVVGILQALLVNSAQSTTSFFLFTCDPEAISHWQVWRLLTSGFLTNPSLLNNLIFSLLGLYFLSPELERRWGAARFTRFFLLSVAVGNLASIAVSRVRPELAISHGFYGPAAAIAALTVAWSREFAETNLMLFFFVPVRGKYLLYVALGFAVLDLIYPVGLSEGVPAPFGGILAGLLFAGTPSPVRTIYLKGRLALLRQRSGVPSALPPELRPGAAPRRGRSGSPPLRVVYGGLEEELKKRKPPKDKRYLN